jgi:DNA-binding IclR family transcriptional regulator
VSQTVERALEIIEFFAEKPRSLGEIAGHLEVHKSTALRLLQTLEAGGFTRRDSYGCYTVGFRMIAVSQLALENLDIHSAAHSRLMALSNELGHTLHLAQLVGNEVVYVDKVEGRGAVKMYSQVGGVAIIHTSGVGKAIVANLEEPLRQQVLATLDLKSYTASTITTVEALERELAITRERGWAEDNREFEDVINCVAVPVRDNRGLVRNAISLTALYALAPLETLRQHVPLLVATAEAISKEFGWTG